MTTSDPGSPAGVDPTSSGLTQVFVASTLYGAATLAAAIDDGAFPDVERRLLVVANNAAFPETTPALSEVAGFEVVRTRFDDVVSLNDLLAPQHPSRWAPREVDLPLLERYLRQAWRVGGDRVHLVVESIQASPSLALARVFADASIDVYADGLMSYGPTRTPPPAQVGTRIERLRYLELVADLRPMLLTEWDVEPVPVSRENFRKVLGTVTESTRLPEVGTGPVALILGQYLSALGLITPAEEEQLHLELLRAAVAQGYRTVVVKPHPTAGDALVGPLLAEAAQIAAEVVVVGEPMLAEALFERLPVTLVLGCFSTALLTASWLYDLPTGRVGTGPLLDRLTPYENSNRIPLTLVDTLLPDLAAGAPPVAPIGRGPDGVDGLVVAVGYAMQPRSLVDRRDTAVRFLSRNQDWALRYFKRRRLRLLDLPGAPVVTRRGQVRRRVRRIRRSLRRRVGGAGQALVGRAR